MSSLLASEESPHRPAKLQGTRGLAAPKGYETQTLHPWPLRAEVVTSYAGCSQRMSPWGCQCHPGDCRSPQGQSPSGTGAFKHRPLATAPLALAAAPAPLGAAPGPLGGGGGTGPLSRRRGRPPTSVRRYRVASPKAPRPRVRMGM